MARKAKVVVSVVDTNEAEMIENAELQAEALNDVEVDSKPSVLSSMIAQVVEAKPETVEASKSEKNEGVGQFIRKLIGEGLSNKAILEIVHEQYGNKNTTYACVAWYRNKMKKAGQVQAKSSALDFINNFAKSNGLSEEAVEILKLEFKVA